MDRVQQVYFDTVRNHPHVLISQIVGLSTPTPMQLTNTETENDPCFPS